MDTFINGINPYNTQLLEEVTGRRCQPERDR